MGYVIAGIKDIHGAPVGDTIVLAAIRMCLICPASRRSNRRFMPDCFRSTPRTSTTFRDALEKLTLNDASLFYEPETSEALGFGFRCGFLGMLHMEIVQERLEREYDLDLITTAPTVVYEVQRADGTLDSSTTPRGCLPGYVEMREPIVEASILVPQEYLGNVMTLCVERRGVQKNMLFTGGQVPWSRRCR